MNVADVTIVVVIGLSVLIGLVRGFVVEVLSLAIWVAAIVLATLLGPTIGERFVALEAPALRIGLGYFIVFVGVLLVGALVTWLMRRLVASTGLSGTDRLLGALFGLVRGGALVAVAVLLLGLTALPREESWQASRLLPGFERLALRLAAWMPEALERRLREADEVLPQPPSAPSLLPAPSEPSKSPA